MHSDKKTEATKAEKKKKTAATMNISRVLEYSIIKRILNLDHLIFMLLVRWREMIIDDFGVRNYEDQFYCRVIDFVLIKNN